MKRTVILLAAAAMVVTFASPVAQAKSTSDPTYDINTLAGKVASLHGTAGLQIRFSAFLEEEAADVSAPPAAQPITPTTPGSTTSSGT